MSNIIHTHADQHRRNLLKGLGAVAVAATMHGRLFAAEAGPTAVVIGAGIGGLSAAWELLKAGFQVSIFEKRSILAAAWWNFNWVLFTSSPMPR
jgi:heterodisulfide reductase subunit A-like polyferredoxin